MSDKKEKKSVISEIDREISDLFEDETPPEQPAVPTAKTEATDVKETPVTQAKAATQVQATEGEAIEEPAKTVKQAEKTSPDEGKGAKQELEKDGIIIKKG